MESGPARGQRGLRQVVELAAPVAVDAHPKLGRMLADRYPRRLDPHNEFHRLLAETAVAYLEHGGRGEVAALALHVHPNTVKHRLRRLAELTGGELPAGPLLDALHWSWALRAWLRPAPTVL